MVSASARVPNFYGYTQARTISNISAHGTSQLGFCRKRTNLRYEMCSAVENSVNVYSQILLGCLMYTHINPLFSSSRLGSLLVFMTAFKDVITYFQNTPHLWTNICNPGYFLLLANRGAQLVTLGRGKEINELTKAKNYAFLEENEFEDETPSSFKFQTSKRVDELGQPLAAPMEIFTFERSHSTELLKNVREVYGTLGYTGPQSINNLKKVKQDYNGLSQADKDTIDSAGNAFSGVHLSICQYCKQNGETLTAVFAIPFDLTDLLNYESLYNVQYNTTNETEWMTINPTEANQSKIKQAIAYIKFVLTTINRGLDDDSDEEVFEEEEEGFDEDEDAKTIFFKDTDKIQQINAFALHVLSAIVSHLILSLILEPDVNVYVPIAPINRGDSETRILTIIEEIKHCKSYYYSNACKEVHNPNVKYLQKWIESEPVYGESQEQFHVLSAEPMFQHGVTELMTYGRSGAAEDTNDLSKSKNPYITGRNRLKKPSGNNSKKKGGRKSKKQSRKNVKKQSRKNKKYTR